MRPTPVPNAQPAVVPVKALLSVPSVNIVLPNEIHRLAPAPRPEVNSPVIAAKTLHDDLLTSLLRKLRRSFRRIKALSPIFPNYSTSKLLENPYKLREDDKISHQDPPSVPHIYSVAF